MGISRYNSEGYFDPVPQMAVSRRIADSHGARKRRKRR